MPKPHVNPTLFVRIIITYADTHPQGKLLWLFHGRVDWDRHGEICTRASSCLAFGGAHPYADHSWDAFRQVDGTELETFVAAVEAVVAQRIPPELKPRVLANDLQALAAAAHSIFAARADRESIDGWTAIGADSRIFWFPAKEDHDAILSHLDPWSHLL